MYRPIHSLLLLLTDEIDAKKGKGRKKKKKRGKTAKDSRAPHPTRHPKLSGMEFQVGVDVIRRQDWGSTRP